MNYQKYVIERLKNFTKKDIIITKHALIRINQRQINIEEVINNILYPKRLEYALKLKAERFNEEKFDCYFGYSKTQCHRYILVLKKNVIIVTIVKINRRWQKQLEKKFKKD